MFERVFVFNGRNVTELRVSTTSVVEDFDAVDRGVGGLKPVLQNLRLSSSFCTCDRNDSIIALSRASPTELKEGMGPALRTFLVNAQKVNGT